MEAPEGKGVGWDVGVLHRVDVLCAILMHLHPIMHMRKQRACAHPAIPRNPHHSHPSLQGRKACVLWSVLRKIRVLWSVLRKPHAITGQVQCRITEHAQVTLYTEANAPLPRILMTVKSLRGGLDFTCTITICSGRTRTHMEGTEYSGDHTHLLQMCQATLTYVALTPSCSLHIISPFPLLVPMSTLPPSPQLRWGTLLLALQPPSHPGLPGCSYVRQHGT